MQISRPLHSQHPRAYLLILESSASWPPETNNHIGHCCSLESCVHGDSDSLKSSRDGSSGRSPKISWTSVETHEVSCAARLCADKFAAHFSRILASMEGPIIAGERSVHWSDLQENNIIRKSLRAIGSGWVRWLYASPLYAMYPAPY